MHFITAGRIRRISLSLSAKTCKRLIAAVFLFSLPVVWFSGLPGLFYYKALVALAPKATENSLDLGRYEAIVQAQPINGLTQNVSGLTYSEATDTLFAVINRPPQIAELSRAGELLRTIPLKGVSDPEGITYVAGDRFIISDEKTQSLHWITVGSGTQALSVVDGDHLRLNIGAMQNMGFEGLSWDSARNRLYITQEMFPSRVIVVEGASTTVGGKGLQLDIGEWKPKGLAGLFMLDLSSASLHERTGNLVLLSHMSSMLVEYDHGGTVLSALPLWRGMQGLDHSIAQAEGVAIGPEGDIFIVSEPNLFYRFAPGKRSSQD